MDWSNANCVAFEVGRQHAKLHAFAKQFMGCTYACTQTCVIEVCFTTKVSS